MKRGDSENVIRAKAYLKGEPTADAEVLKLAELLQKEREFGYAWRVLGRARAEAEVSRDPKLKLKLAQEQAASTYQDPDLPVDERLDRALEILNENDNLARTQNQETLKVAGAIYKRKWEMTSQKQHLERALAYYLRGYCAGVAADYGYTAINAAFALDQLAFQEMNEARKAGAGSELAEARRDQAKQIREQIIQASAILMQSEPQLEKDYRFLVTIAEAHFGLGQYKQAEEWLLKAASLPEIAPWQYETTARQLASLTLLAQEPSAATVASGTSGASRALMVFLKGNTAAVNAAFAGKVGLGLSGGGFRASLYHIGVLAKLAELDMLRHVEVLSCVSGGSIIGAYYYLEVKRLLESKSDDEITREDYIEIVKRVERDFLAGVQRNVRMRVIASFWSNIKMVFKPNYSRTERVGELYEKEIFSRIDDGNGNKPRYINNLYVMPKGEPESFKPKYDNWRRRAKVPILVLNATALNTGHNWQFTASWMGEPPARAANEVDRNYRLRRLRYSQAPPKFQNIRLGHAVAASSCVPGLFEPLVLDGLYEGEDANGETDKITVRLVDGGVYDNQGIAALLDQDCTVMLVSDASGQMHAQDNPSAGVLGVPLRSNSILMSRVREAQFLDLIARRRAMLLRGLMFIHLKMDLPVEPVDWAGCDEPHDKPNDEGALTPYHIRKDVQQELSAIRTDLDSFTDTEAFALMTSGYRMAEEELVSKKRIEGFDMPTGKACDWRFLAIEEPMKQEKAEGARYKGLMLLLKAGRSTAFKIWKISPVLRRTGLLLGIAALGLLAWACFRYRAVAIVTVGMIGATLATLAASAIVGKTVVRVVRLRETLARIGIGIGLALFGWILARIHLYVFDRMFLRRGRVVIESKAKDETEKARAAAV